MNRQDINLNGVDLVEFASDESGIPACVAKCRKLIARHLKTFNKVVVSEPSVRFAWIGRNCFGFTVVADIEHFDVTLNYDLSGMIVFEGEWKIISGPQVNPETFEPYPGRPLLRPSVEDVRAVAETYQKLFERQLRKERTIVARR